MKPHIVLFAVGYPVAIAGIAQLRRILRQRDTKWFVAEEAGTAAIVAGWALRGDRPVAVALNAVWGVAFAAVWFATRRPDGASPQHHRPDGA